LLRNALPAHRRAIMLFNFSVHARCALCAPKDGYRSSNLIKSELIIQILMHFLKCPCLDGDAKLTDDQIQKTTAKKNISKNIKDSRNDYCEIKRDNGKSKRSGCKFRQKLKVFSVTPSFMILKPL
jgi:hypothetical protein